MEEGEGVEGGERGWMQGREEEKGHDQQGEKE